MAKRSKISNGAASAVASTARVRISQSDIPSYSLSQALRVAQTIADNYALQPTRPLLVAQGMNTQPGSSGFRMLCGASVAYGLTEGGYNTAQIAISPLGRRAIAPLHDGDDAMARREALLKPKVLGRFLKQYDGAKVPREDIGCNVLADMGVPRVVAKRTLDLILEGARGVGFIREINGVLYIDLQGTPTSPARDAVESEFDDDGLESPPDDRNFGRASGVEEMPPLPAVTARVARAKIFISHSKNMQIVDQVKTMLNVAEVDYEVAVESESTAIPVPDKIFDAMRNCTAAVICVTKDPSSMMGPTSKPIINQNVLIEIGAAFVLYERRVILLWERGVDIPSNLQGLYRCEFDGNELSWGAGMKLMEAVKKFRG